MRDITPERAAELEEIWAELEAAADARDALAARWPAAAERWPAAEHAGMGFVMPCAACGHEYDNEETEFEAVVSLALLSGWVWAPNGVRCPTCVAAGADIGSRLCGDCYRCVELSLITTGRDILCNQMSRMFLCRTCGNKRCPTASYHGYQCTHSNELGQPGSRY